MYDKSQAVELQERMDKSGARQREVEMVPLIRMLQASAVVMRELMTESQAWNRYLEILQGRMKALQQIKADAERALAGPDIWDAGQMMKLKGDVRVLTGQVEILQDVMRLPQALVSNGASSQEIIDNFEAKYGHSTSTEETQP